MHSWSNKTTTKTKTEQTNKKENKKQKKPKTGNTHYFVFLQTTNLIIFVNLHFTFVLLYRWVCEMEIIYKYSHRKSRIIFDTLKLLVLKRAVGYSH